MNAIEMVNLPQLMDRTRGRPEILIGLIDGPVLLGHPDLARENIREVPGRLQGACASANNAACFHGTFVAGILFARRGSAAPSICPDCTLLVRPIFPEEANTNGNMPSATPEELAVAIVDCVNSGARLVNLSAALAQPSSSEERKVEESLDYASRRGVIVVAAAGNQGTLGTTTVTRHPWVIPVTACDSDGRPTQESNLASSIGRRGLSAPGNGITSLGADGKPISLAGTSAATPFVTGTAALLWSEFPRASPTQMKLTLTRSMGSRRGGLVPPLLNAWGSYQSLIASQREE